MALNIKGKETEELATEIASQTGESKTGAVRQALRERRERSRLGDDFAQTDIPSALA